ncbi:MAG: hypothetical protein OEZ06_13940 [Myxococcales bacterium]|nr:hypothetical protein [Myxococcales bacterium]
MTAQAKARAGSGGGCCRALLPWALVALSLLLCRPAQASQPQDWIVGAPREGSFLNLDLIFGGAQMGVEHRLPVYGGSNMLTLRGSALAALPFGSSQVDLDFRVLNLTLGMSLGAQDTWRNQRFAPGEPTHRKERRQREAAGEFDSDVFAFWEGRASLAFPFNDYVVLNHLTTWRKSGAAPGSFDNLSNVVHDGDRVSTDFQLFFKHRDFGALAPTFQLLHYPDQGNWKTQLNYGFLFVTRAGLTQRDDVLLWQMYFHTGPVFGGGVDNRDEYGAAFLRGPLTLLLAYRSVIEL